MGRAGGGGLGPLGRGGAPAWADDLARGLVPWGWLLLRLGPPLLVWLRRRRETATDAVGSAPPATAAPLAPLGQLERQFQAVLAHHLPDQPARYGHGLALALRAAALQSAFADHVQRL